MIGHDLASPPLAVRQQPVVQREPLDDDYDNRPVYDASAAYLWGIAIGGAAVGALWAAVKVFG